MFSFTGKKLLALPAECSVLAVKVEELAGTIQTEGLTIKLHRVSHSWEKGVNGWVSKGLCNRGVGIGSLVRIMFDVHAARY
jgi:hypothetical protein